MCERLHWKREFARLQSPHLFDNFQAITSEQSYRIRTDGQSNHHDAGLQQPQEECNTRANAWCVVQAVRVATGGACGARQCVRRLAVRGDGRCVRRRTVACGAWCVVTGVRGQPRARARGEGHRPRPSKARGRGGQGKAHWSPANSSFRCNLSHKHALADGQKGTKAAAGARHGGVRHACKTRAKRGQRGQRAWGHEGGWVVMQCSSSTGGSSRHTQGLQHVSKHQQMGVEGRGGG